MGRHEKITRRGFVRKSLAAASGLALTTGGCTRLRKVNKAVLITIDTLRADHVGCYGYPRSVSPFIDQLAKNGILFRNVVASSSHTNPSHASILTSLHPVQHRLYSNGHLRLDPSIYTMAHMFGDAGYETAAFCSVYFLVALQTRFDVFDTTKNRDDKEYRRATATVDSAVDWLRDKKPEDRFFLWIHLFDPHNPYYPPMECVERIAFTSKAERDRFVAYWAETQNIPRDFYKSDELLVRTLTDYDAEILFVDREIERLFSFMEQQGLNSDAIWVITSDHGEGLGNHYYAGHGKHIYNEQLRVPLIFFFTNRSHAGTNIEKLVRHVDVLPTIADIVGGSVENQTLSVQGRSLLPAMSRKKPELGSVYAFSQRRPPTPQSKAQWEAGEVYCLQDLTFKYMHHSQAKDEFFDLRSDPFEIENLIDGPSEAKAMMGESVTRLYDSLLSESGNISAGGFDERRIDELKSLGYIK